MDKLIEFAIQKYPDVMGGVALALMGIIILASFAAPTCALWWLKKHISKDRYVFAQNKYLYCLDTLTGKIRVSRGLVFQEVSEIKGISNNQEENQKG